MTALAVVARPAAAVEVTVSHWAELMYGVPWAIAMKKGYFKDAGIDITGLITSDGGGTSIRNMMASKFPYAETSIGAAVSAIQEGIDIRIVDGAVNSPADLLLAVMPNSPIKTMKDLVGRKMGFTRAKATSELILVMMLEGAGIDPKSVTRLALGTVGGALTAMSTGTVDAALLLEPTRSASGDKYRILARASDLAPHMTQHVGVVGTQYGKDHPDQIRAIIAGRRAGWAYLQDHPDEAAQITADAYDMPVGVLRKAIGGLLPAGYWGDGHIDYVAMNATVAGMQEIGAIPPGPVDWSKMVDESYLPKDLQSK